jgi:hypothetical protein
VRGGRADGRETTDEPRLDRERATELIRGVIGSRSGTFRRTIALHFFTIVRTRV